MSLPLSQSHFFHIISEWTFVVSHWSCTALKLGMSTWCQEALRVVFFSCVHSVHTTEGKWTRDKKRDERFFFPSLSSPPTFFLSFLRRRRHKGRGKKFYESLSRTSLIWREWERYQGERRKAEKVREMGENESAGLGEKQNGFNKYCCVYSVSSSNWTRVSASPLRPGSLWWEAFSKRIQAHSRLCALRERERGYRIYALRKRVVGETDEIMEIGFPLFLWRDNNGESQSSRVDLP